MTQAPKPLSAERLESLLQERGDMAARPRQTPREVFAKWLDNFGVGAGVGVATGVLLWAIGAPDPLLMSAPPAVGLATWGGMMAWRGSLDERSDWRNVRNVRRTVTAARSEYDAQVRTLRRQLDAAFDEIETLERSLDQVGRERDMALLDLGRERQIAAQSKRTTFVRAEDPTPQDVKDAQEMVRHYFGTGSHLSRRKAADDKRWPSERHAAAQGLLVRAGVVAVNGKQPAMLAQTLDEALSKLSTHMVHAHSQQPPVMAARADYVEPDEE